MANPLARIVMENIARKSNLKDISKKTGYAREKAPSKAKDMDLKSLDSLADQVRGYKEDKVLDANKSARSGGVKTSRENNLSREEVSLISDLIAGKIDISNKQEKTNIDPASSQRDLRTDRDSLRVRKNALSLDKLAKNLKNGI